MFSLSRIPKQSHRSNRDTGKTTEKNRAKVNTDPLFSTSNIKPKKRRRGPPIPSFFDSELEKLERAFLDDDDDRTGSNNAKAQPKRLKIEGKPAPSPTPDKTPTDQRMICENTNKRAPSPSSGSAHCPIAVDDDDDDSLFEIETFAGKTESPNPPTIHPKSEVLPSRVASSTVDQSNPIPLAIKAMDQSNNSFVMDSNKNPSGNRVISRPESVNQSLRSCTRLNIPESQSQEQSSMSDDLRKKVDEIMSKADFEQLSLKNIYTLLGRETYKGQKDAVRAYVYGKLGIPVSKAKKKAIGKDQIPITDRLPKKAPPQNIVPSAVTSPMAHSKKQSTVETKNPSQHTEPKAENEQSFVDSANERDAKEVVGLASLPAALVEHAPRQLEKPAEGELKTVKAQARVKNERKQETNVRANTKSIDVVKRSKTSAKRKGAPEPKCCQLCAQCPCRVAKDSEEVAKLNSAQSDQAVEKSLIKRLQKCEKITERYASQEDLVRRQLKNHRRGMWRKRERLQQMARQSQQNPVISPFLPDADELEKNFTLSESGKAVPEGEAGKARDTMFGKPPRQITLLSWMGGKVEDSVDTDPKPKPERDENESIEASGKLTETTCYEPKKSVGPTEETCREDMDVDDLPEDEDVPVERIVWENGEARGSNGDRVVSLSCTLWSCALTGRPHSTWDRLFDDPSSTENLGMDDLLEMMDETDETNETKASFTDETSERVEMSMLSQRGQAHAQHILDKFQADPKLLECIQSICPEWEENVRYALAQKNQGDVVAALSDLQEKRNRLERGKAALERIIEKHEALLSLYEESLTRSLSRLGPSSASRVDSGEIDDHVSIMTQNDGGPVIGVPQNGPVEICEEASGLSPTSHGNHFSFACEIVLDDAHNCALGRRSVETDVETLIPTASPRRSSIATCRSQQSPTTSTTAVLGIDNRNNIFVASQ